jgi:predicted Zn-dependent protease
VDHTISGTKHLNKLFTYSQKLALALAMAGAVLGAAAQTTSRLPNIGDGNSKSVPQEKRLGESIMRQLMRDPDYMDDPVLVDYLQSIYLLTLLSSTNLNYPLFLLAINVSCFISFNSFKLLNYYTLVL